MAEQEPAVRNENFLEVALGYTPEQAVEEARRCLQCKNPLCVQGCPVSVNIPAFIGEVADGNFDAACDIILETNLLPAICGRVCPQENQCEGLCIRGKRGEPVGIGRLERFVADWKRSASEDGRSSVGLKNAPAKPANVSLNLMSASLDSINTSQNNPTVFSVAVVGAGPAGLTCAADLARAGIDVTLFEALHTPGGVLMYGIPEFRLPKAIVQYEIDNIAAMGVKIETNVLVGRSISIDGLLERGFDAIFIGSGAGLPVFMNIPGENLNGVYSANEFLTRVNLMKAYRFPHSPTPVRVGRRVAVVGGGNVAMDAARTAKRLGADEVFIVYRRGDAELPARREEIHHAREEGIIFRLLSSPLAISGNEGWVTSMECVEMELGEPDSSGRKRPVVKAGSEFSLPLDTVIMAIGQTPNPLIRKTTSSLETNKWGCIVVDEETMATSRESVYAGGDTVTGAATVILAMGAGKKAAASIQEYLKSRHLKPRHTESC